MGHHDGRQSKPVWAHLLTVNRVKDPFGQVGAVLGLSTGETITVTRGMVRGVLRPAP